MMRALATLLVAVTGVAGLAGCGSSASSSTTTTPPVEQQQQRPGGRPSGQAFAQLRACLKKQGVTLPSGPPSGGGGAQGSSGQPPQIDPSAFKACQKYLPQGGPGAGGPPPGGAGGSS